MAVIFSVVEEELSLKINFPIIEKMKGEIDFARGGKIAEILHSEHEYIRRHFFLTNGSIFAF